MCERHLSLSITLCFFLILFLLIFGMWNYELLQSACDHQHRSIKAIYVLYGFVTNNEVKFLLGSVVELRNIVCSTCLWGARDKLMLTWIAPRLVHVILARGSLFCRPHAILLFIFFNFRFFFFIFFFLILCLDRGEKKSRAY